MQLRCWVYPTISYAAEFRELMPFTEAEFLVLKTHVHTSVLVFLYKL